jgi:hypothetical protein
VRLHFHGYVTPPFRNIQHEGQTIDFRAFDLCRVKGGRIVENVPLEDDLTVPKHAGAVKP